MSESDFIREVDEEMRNEQLKKMWDKFGPYVIGFALLIVLGTAASKGYDYWRTTQSAKSGDAFIEAIALSDSGNSEQAIAALETLKTSGFGGYPLLAEMRIAAEKSAMGDVDDAIALYSSVANNADYDVVIQDLARIRANVLMLDQGKADDVILQLSGQMDGGAFRHTARELVLLAYLENKAFAEALPIADRVVADAETPTQLRQRAEVYASYIRSKIVVDSKESAQ
ncbi:tetratricopeptide repeat protein [Cohaesibacter celericrescens]|uniref:Ancillary SecYEG translocon subunit/Cell division coordinator CpoB TPR domain-containing protein n=1 Tax=Cohaesibacter celericrescens TaxID=2067669 RepID=A0A2N5XSC3_9HYPH|nr:tetratricopeptide repeat protein [Cohaesibacter celericrescens]PLW77360.1 hypothetical protein C0081_08435 [Cohaesibacter celericrescens]